MSADQILLRLVERNLSLNLLEDAKFYAERLYYESGGSEESLNVLAQCYFRQNKIKQCYLILQNCRLASNRYLLATCCMSLGKLTEAEAALVPAGGAPQTLHAAATIPGGAAGLYLLGSISRRNHQREKAIKFLTMSLQVGFVSDSSVVPNPQN